MPKIPKFSQQRAPAPKTAAPRKLRAAKPPAPGWQPVEFAGCWPSRVVWRGKPRMRGRRRFDGRGFVDAPLPIVTIAHSCIRDIARMKSMPRQLFRLRGRLRANADIDLIREFIPIMSPMDGPLFADAKTGSLYRPGGEHINGCGLYLSAPPRGAKLSQPYDARAGWECLD